MYETLLCYVCAHCAQQTVELQGITGLVMCRWRWGNEGG